jgi:hypothetical protein
MPSRCARPANRLANGLERDPDRPRLGFGFPQEEIWEEMLAPHVNQRDQFHERAGRLMLVVVPKF